MRNKDKQKDNKVSIISETTTITGKINSGDSIRIEGTIIGNIKTVKKIVLSEKAIVDGEINANSIIIEGKMKGIIKANDIVSLLPNSIINGNIITKRLSIKEGCIINGNIEIINNIKNQHNILT